MRRVSTLSNLIFCSFLLLPAIASSQEKPQQNTGRPQTGWSTLVRGGAVYQFDSDLDDGGSYSSSRVNIEVGQNYAWSRRDTASFVLGYSYDVYDFSDGESGGIAFESPWEDIHTLSISSPLRKGIGERWTAFLIPSLRSTGESGADFSKTITGGGLTGVSCRFGDRLTIGPGIGVFTQIEDSATLFPVLIIHWKITDQLSLETGRGLAATLGPGLTLNYLATPSLRLAVGGRYEKLRFRLDKDGSVVNGIGEDSSFPLFASCSCNISPRAVISVMAGVETGGNVTLENSQGHSILEESYDSGIFSGITFRVRL
ncbi:hypothetical protein JWG39_13875 [Desulforhopalus vacuolatus]|uniref:hypothetical protein n=1 Tax=Desulforhopalus vacuolatus TaxID=40414 RepID=UPI0019622CA4|nr:hypothetical protein [Desulforhopalus vacuolatus]MBM9520903.1 hypothetical protein [Desulforhopalus vacuolatus]